MAQTRPTAPRRLLVLGGTGVVGRVVVAQALADSRFSEVVAPTRRALAPQPRLLNPVVDFAQWPENAPWWQVDAVICALGTTMHVAGSEAAFAAVDRDLPVRAARSARAAGAVRFALVSSLGASPRGNFYLRTKAQAEEGIRAVAYPAYLIVRPSLIDADRDGRRPVEAFWQACARILRPVTPQRYRAVRPEQVARALLDDSASDRAGETILESESLQG